MNYIVYDKNKKVYRDFMGKEKSEVWNEFDKYLKDRSILNDDWEVVEISNEDYELIKLWFKEEHLLVSVDKIIIDNSEIIL